MIHHPGCGCGDALAAEKPLGEAHLWLVPGAVVMRYPGEALAPLHDLGFGNSRWKYMGERKRWRRLIPEAAHGQRPIHASPTVCDTCKGLRYFTAHNRKGQPFTKICRVCGLKRSVLVFRVRGPRMREWDHANLTQACRALIDSLVERLWLVDDGPRFMVANYYDHTKGTQPGTVIVIDRG